jgi:hypothetical protein
MSPCRKGKGQLRPIDVAGNIGLLHIIDKETKKIIAGFGRNFPVKRKV